MKLIPKIKYTHLHVHDHLSILDGIGKPGDYCLKLIENKQTSIAITNHGNINSFFEWDKESKKHNIKIIYGCELYIVESVEDKQKKEKRGHLTVWVKNSIGYYNLLKILSFSNLYGFYKRPRCSFEYFLENCEGLIIGTACTSSFINLENSLNFLLKLKEKTEVFLEVMPHIYKNQIEHNKLCLEYHNKYNIPLLATYDTHYPNLKDSECQDVLLCMQTKDKMSNASRWSFDIKDLFLCDTQYIINKFEKQNVLSKEQYISAINNTQYIVDNCNFNIEKQPIVLPIPQKYIGKDINEEIHNICITELKNKKLYNEKYINRLNYELEVIKEKKFIEYFLIVADIVNWCKENNIFVGPRGSGSSCLVSYLLGIIEIDPVKHNLIFDRFINKHRQSMPDLDLDVQDNKRSFVLDRLKQIYGDKRIANVTTFLKMEARGIIRDVSRVFDIPLNEVDAFSKKIDGDIEDAINDTEEGKKFNEKYPKIIEIAKTLQGQIKAQGMHAAGIIISPIDLDQSKSTHLIERNGNILINWGKEDAEYAGLIKFDFLGLSTWAIISDCLNLIKKEFGENINIYKINFNDQKIYNSLTEGNTVGIFQVSSNPLTNLIKRVKVNSLDDISDVLSLIRPGCLDSGTTEEYLQRKFGKEWEKKNSIYEEVTKNTYGLCVYQEDLMFIIHKVAGLSLAIADSIRGVIGKKRDAKYMLPYKEQFINGCLEQKTLTKEEAEEWWIDLEKFARYGFARSHSLSYAYVTYFTAYLKYYYPYQFICASLGHCSDEQKKQLLQESKRLKLKIIPPKLNAADAYDWVVKDNKLYVPFKEVKGIGPKALETIKSYQDSKKKYNLFGEDIVIKGKLKTILDEIGAFSEEIPENIDNYFDLGIVFNPKVAYRNLYSIFQNIERYNIDDVLTGNFYGHYFAKKTLPIYDKQSIISCTECELRSSKIKPVTPEFGEYNIMILFESPHWKDNENKKLLFNELKKHKYKKEWFGIDYFLKCEGNKENKKEIKQCVEKHLTNSLNNVRFVLSFGNTGIDIFNNSEGRIISMSGKTIWNEQYECWVTYCISPNLVNWKPDQFLELFENSIKNFCEMLDNIGGIK